MCHVRAETWLRFLSSCVGGIGDGVEKVMLAVVCICVRVCVCGSGEPLVQLLLFKAVAMERRWCRYLFSPPSSRPSEHITMATGGFLTATGHLF